MANEISHFDSIQKLRYLYQLKNVERACSVGNRKESSAEHSWSCLVLANFFWNICDTELFDIHRVYNLLIYHDVEEIPFGDIPLDPSAIPTHTNPERAIRTVLKHIPEEVSSIYLSCSDEFRECKTWDAKFANAIDKLDAIIQELDYKEDWKGWSEAFLREKKEQYFVEFPAIHAIFNDILSFMNKEGYFNT